MMKCAILHHLDPHISDAEIGGKARSLARLQALGYQVPQWWSIPSGCFDSIAGENIKALLASNFDPIMVQEFSTELLSPLIVQQIADMFQAATSGKLALDAKWAVRSSALSEDGNTTSFAGQFESFLNVTEADIPLKICEVWQSGLHDRLREYRKENNLQGFPEIPAVIVQEMVDADFAGVSFGANPVTGSRKESITSVVQGLGDKLVDGAESGWSFTQKSNGEIVCDEPPSNPLPATLLAEVFQVTRCISRQYGRSQDVEWAWSNGKLYVLQSRPISTLGSVVESDGKKRLWDNCNIAESYNGVTTPLTYSFAKHVYEGVYIQLCLLLRVPQKRIEQDSWVYPRLLGYIQGRIYYNLPVWNHMLSMLPGFRLNQKFMEQMMGAEESLPEEYLQSIHQATSSDHLLEKFGMLRTIGKLLVYSFSLKRLIEQFDKRLRHALDRSPDSLESLRVDELAEYYGDLEKKLLRKWDAPMINDLLAMIYFGALNALCLKWLGSDNAHIGNDLVSGEGGMVSTEPARRIEALAKIAAKDEKLLEFLSQRVCDLASYGRVNREFAVGLQEYLDEFGDRCMEELKLESPTFRDNPIPLLTSIYTLALTLKINPEKSFTRGGHDSRKKAESIMVESFKRKPLKLFFFRVVLSQARKRIKDRENLRLKRTQLFARIRLIYLEIGKRFWEANLLPNPRDIFFLTMEETLSFIEGTSVNHRIAPITKTRKEEHFIYKQQEPSNRFETSGAVYLGNNFQRKQEFSGGQEDIRGIPCYPGIVKGKVRVVNDPQTESIQEGEILVAARTDPGWVVLFPLASALLVQYGSLLSHSAIVSRELGIPAIVSVRNVTTLLQTGDVIEIDGSQGTISIIEKNESNEH